MEEMVKEFKGFFIKKEEGTLKTWIEEAVKPESALRNFAENLNNDLKQSTMQ